MVSLPLLRSALLVAAFLAGPAFAALQASERPAPPLIEVAPEAEKPVLVISPRVMEAAGVSEDRTKVVLDLLVGHETAVRLGLFLPAPGERTRLVFEGIFGGALGVAGITPVAGGGVRLQFELARSGNLRNMLLVSPAFDVLVAWDDSPEDQGMVDLGPDSNVIVLSTNAELSWLHRFSAHFGVVLGLHAGGQVSLGGLSNIGEETRGRVAPELSVLFGVRF